MKIDNAIINNVDFFVVEDDEGVKVKIRQQITPEQKAWIKSHEQYIKDIVITQWFISEMKQYEHLWSNGDWVAVNYENYLYEEKGEINVELFKQVVGES